MRIVSVSLTEAGSWPLMAHTPPTASRSHYASAVVEGSDGRGKCHAEGGLDRKGAAEAVLDIMEGSEQARASLQAAQ